MKSIAVNGNFNSTITTPVNICLITVIEDDNTSGGLLVEGLRPTAPDKIKGGDG